MKLPQYQQQTVDEKKAVDERLQELQEFVKTDEFQALPTNEQVQINQQTEVLGTYARIVNDRVQGFPKKG
jgi:hypothetical protein